MQARTQAFIHACTPTCTHACMYAHLHACTPTCTARLHACKQACAFSHASSLPPSTWIHARSRAHAHALRNHAVTLSSGEIIAAMDDDDLYGRDYLPSMLAHLRKPGLGSLGLVNLVHYVGMQVMSNMCMGMTQLLLYLSLRNR